MNTQENGLPAAMQAKLDAARATDATSAAVQGQVITPPVPGAAQVVAPPVPNQTVIAETQQSTVLPPTDRITLNRDEYNDLLAAKGRTTTAEGKAEVARLALEEAQHRLTELAGQGKSGSDGGAAVAAPPAPVSNTIDTSNIKFTDEETEQYGETRAFIEKVVDLRVAKTLNELLPGLTAQIQDAKTTATSSSEKLREQQKASFAQQLKQQVPNLNQLFEHKHWDDYLQETEPMSGASISTLIGHHAQAGTPENLASLVAIYKNFAKKYSVDGNAEIMAGYNGAGPSSNGSQLPPENQEKTKLKLSDRTKASEDYRKGRITHEELTVIVKKFSEAEKENNIDYNA